MRGRAVQGAVISERKAAGEALVASEHWLRESQRISRIGTYVLDIRTDGWTRSEILDEIFGIGGPAWLYETWFHDAVLMAASVLILTRSAYEPKARWAWLAFGLAMTSWCVGSIAWIRFTSEATRAENSASPVSGATAGRLASALPAHAQVSAATSDTTAVP